MFTVNQLSKIASITPRTLHYYDEIGLLKPTTIGENGYRYYGEDALFRLQQIMFYRELDISLEDIKKIMGRRNFDVVNALATHKAQLEKRINRLENLIKTVDNTIDHMKGKKEMSKKQLFDAFSEEQQAEYEKEAMQMYDPEIVLAQLNMLGSHDTPRFMTLANEDVVTAKLAFLCQMTVPGAPNIYYGDEIGMTGRTDPHCRRAFPWQDTGAWQTDLHDEVRRLTALRHRSAALRRGAFHILLADRTTCVYERRLGDERVVVALNPSRQPATFVLPPTGGLPLAEEAVGAALGEAIADGQKVTMPPRSGRVWSTFAV